MAATPRRRVAILSQRGDLLALRGFDPDRHVIEALRSAGWEVTPAVPWQDAPTMDWSPYGAAIIRSTWDYVHDVPGFMASLRHIQQQGVLVCNDPERIVAWNTDKTYLQRFAAAGVAIIPSVFVSAAGCSTENVVARIERLTAQIAHHAQHCAGGVVVKPTVSLGSVDTFHVLPADPATVDAPFIFVEDAIVANVSRSGRGTDFGPSAPPPITDTAELDTLVSEDGGPVTASQWPIRRFSSKANMVAHVFHERACVIQPFVDTLSRYGELALFFFGTECSHGLSKRPKAGDFRVQHQFGGWFTPLSRAELDQLGVVGLAEDLVRRHIGAVPLYARIDLVWVPATTYAACKATNGEAFGVSCQVDNIAPNPAWPVTDDGVQLIPALIEMELIEPYLFLEHAPPSALAAFIAEFERQYAAFHHTSSQST